MSTTMAVLLARAAEQQSDAAAGTSDARSDSMFAVFQGSLSHHRQLNLLNDVFNGFITSNAHQGRRYSLLDLLSVNDKCFFRFAHLSIPYLATVDIYRGHDHTYTVLRLPNDGFVYAAREGQQLTRHRSETWTALPPTETMAVFPAIAAHTRELCNEARVFYNYPEQRLDMVLFPRDAATRGLMINFEPGYPYLDDRAPRGRYG